MVEKNISLILKYFPNTTFRATIYKDTIENTFENYLFANVKGFKKVFFIPDVRHEWSEEQKQKLFIEIQKIFLFYEFCFENGQYPIEFETINKAFHTMLLRDIYAYKNTQI